MWRNHWAIQSLCSKLHFEQPKSIFRIQSIKIWIRWYTQIAYNYRLAPNWINWYFNHNISPLMGFKLPTNKLACGDDLQQSDIYIEIAGLSWPWILDLATIWRRQNSNHHVYLMLTQASTTKCTPFARTAIMVNQTPIPDHTIFLHSFF